MTLEITVVQYKAESVRCLSFRQTIITRMLQRLLLQRLQSVIKKRYLPSHTILGEEFGPEENRQWFFWSRYGQSIEKICVNT